jgi:hypothetical protein
VTGRFPYDTHKEAAEPSLRELRVAAFVNGHWHWLREAEGSSETQEPLVGWGFRRESEGARGTEHQIYTLENCPERRGVFLCSSVEINRLICRCVDSVRCSAKDQDQSRPWLESPASLAEIASVAGTGPESRKRARLASRDQLVTQPATPSMPDS